MTFNFLIDGNSVYKDCLTLDPSLVETALETLNQNQEGQRFATLLETIQRTWIAELNTNTEIRELINND